MAENPTQAPPPIAPLPPSSPPLSSPLPDPEAQARMWNMFCHLSPFVVFVIPFGNILGPLVIWQIKKNEFPSVDVHGKAALNFQLTVLISALISLAAGFAATFFCCLGVILFFVSGGISLAGLILAVVAGAKANNGENYQYPFSFIFVR